MQGSVFVLEPFRLPPGAASRPGAPVKSEEEVIGKVTSNSGEVSLGYVKKKWKEPGTKVEIDGVTAVVGSLPWQERAERPPDREQGDVSRV